MRRIRHNFLAAVAVTTGLLCCPAWARPKRPALSEKDFRDALTAIRQIAMDKKQTQAHRANAVTAYVKALLWRKRHDDAMTFCRQVLAARDQPAVIDAALRAGCRAERDRRGHLRAEMDFLTSCSRGPARQAATAMTRELNRAVQTLTSLAARAMVPAAIVPRLPPWAGGTPPALRVALPKIAPPTWYRRVAFPPLKEPKR